jgi:hypothetical protein
MIKILEKLAQQLSARGQKEKAEQVNGLLKKALVIGDGGSTSPFTPDQDRKDYLEQNEELLNLRERADDLDIGEYYDPNTEAPRSPSEEFTQEYSTLDLSQTPIVDGIDVPVDISKHPIAQIIREFFDSVLKTEDSIYSKLRVAQQQPRPAEGNFSSVKDTVQKLSQFDEDLNLYDPKYGPQRLIRPEQVYTIIKAILPEYMGSNHRETLLQMGLGLYDLYKDFYYDSNKIVPKYAPGGQMSYYNEEYMKNLKVDMPEQPSPKDLPDIE